MLQKIEVSSKLQALLAGLWLKYTSYWEGGRDGDSSFSLYFDIGTHLKAGTSICLMSGPWQTRELPMLHPSPGYFLAASLGGSLFGGQEFVGPILLGLIKIACVPNRAVISLGHRVPK